MPSPTITGWTGAGSEEESRSISLFRIFRTAELLQASLWVQFFDRNKKKVNDTRSVYTHQYISCQYVHRWYKTNALSLQECKPRIWLNKEAFPNVVWWVCFQQNEDEHQSNILKSWLTHIFPVFWIHCVRWIGLLYVTGNSAESKRCVLSKTFPKKSPISTYHLHVEEHSLRLAHRMYIKKPNSQDACALPLSESQTSTWMDGYLMGSCQGLLVRLYNPKRVKREVMQRGEGGKNEGEPGGRGGGWVGGPMRRKVWNKQGLMHLYYSNLCGQVQCKQRGRTDRHFNHGRLNGCSVPALLHWTFH